MANGDQKETGHVSVFANGKFRTHSDRVEIDADKDVQIVAPVEVNLTGTESVHVEAGTFFDEEGSDVIGVPGGGARRGLRHARDPLPARGPALLRGRPARHDRGAARRPRSARGRRADPARAAS